MKTHPLAALVMVLVSGFSLVHAQWVHTGGPEGRGIYSLAFQGNMLFAGTTTGAFRSTNSGSSWAPAGFGGDTASVIAFAGDDSSFFAWAGERSLYYSADHGLIWRLADTALRGTWYPARSSLFLRGKSLFANRSVGGSVSTAGLYRSTDQGATWVSVLPGLLANTFAVQDSVLLVAGQDAIGPIRTHLYRSSDNGLHWDPVGSLFQYGGLQFAVHDGWLYSGGFGIDRSSDHGASWMSAQEGFGTHEVSCFAEAPGSLFVGSWANGVHVSTDDGATWTPVNEGLPEAAGVTSLAIHDNTLFAASTGGVWRRPLSELLTGVQAIPAPVPASVALSQNYPNPFNPTTTIQYALPQRSYVTLIVYNNLGQKVAELVNSEVAAGYHEVQFNAGTLASGVYFYRMQGGGYTATRKLILMR